MKKKILSFFLVIITLFSLCSCGHTEEELKQRDEWEKQGKTNIVNYIKEKYNEDFKIEEIVVTQRKESLVPVAMWNYTPYVYATGKIQDKECVVVTDASKKSTEYCYDNFQEEEIQKDLEEYILKLYSKEPIYAIFSIYDYDNDDYSILENNQFIHNKYNGDIIDFLENNCPQFCDIYINYINIDTIEDIKFSEKAIKNISNLFVINFTEKGNSFGFEKYTKYTIDEYLPYIKEIIYYSHNAEENEIQGYYKVNFKDNDKFSYAKLFTKTSNFDFSCNEQVDMTNWDSEKYTFSQVSEIYKFNSDFNIYFPLTSIQEYKEDANYCFCVYFTDSDNITQYEFIVNGYKDENYMHLNSDTRYNNGYWFVAEKQSIQQ